MVDSNRIEGTVNKAKGKVEQAAGSFIGDAKTQAEGVFDEFSGRAQATFGKAKDAARDGTDAVRSFTEDRPLQSLMIAGLIGFGLGLIASRR
ncbi:CsbD family protein [Roseiterribacter gracilis]|uniref:CsbD-like domain-containing protein n=1 Tax=Roseiterribacter gracilis TaxID=2812848 RepID=A0A8S8XBE8_9PROT|nr:hypothetical protein TMPK1_07230 [Rhodospirillales bacterium TMPK1]